MRRHPSWLFLVPALLLLAEGVAAEPAADASPLSAREVLTRAFRARYELDHTSTIDLVMRNELGQERRRRTTLRERIRKLQAPRPGFAGQRGAWLHDPRFATVADKPLPFEPVPFIHPNPGRPGLPGVGSRSGVPGGRRRRNR